MLADHEIELTPNDSLTASLAAGTPIWLPDGTSSTVEQVVKMGLPVLSYDSTWDSRPVRYGPSQPPRDTDIGNLVPWLPASYVRAERQPVWAISFTSGRLIHATIDHHWMTRRQRGRQSWEWKRTADLANGDHVPMPLNSCFSGQRGDALDGYFVGAMLGDGGMTGSTPEFHGAGEDGAVAFMYEYAARLGCEAKATKQPGCVRLRITDPRPGRNAAIDVLRSYEVWGKRVEKKELPNRSFSRQFWLGCLSGLIDTDGCVRRRRNSKGYVYGSVEFGVVSQKLAEQTSDTLLRLGVPNTLRKRPIRSAGRTFKANFPLHVVEVSAVQSITRLSELLHLRVSYKSSLLTALGQEFRNRTGKKSGTSEMHGYDPRVVMDRIASIKGAGERTTFGLAVGPSKLIIANGIVTGA